MFQKRSCLWQNNLTIGLLVDGCNQGRHVTFIVQESWFCKWNDLLGTGSVLHQIGYFCCQFRLCWRKRLSSLCQLHIFLAGFLKWSCWWWTWIYMMVCNWCCKGGCYRLLLWWIFELVGQLGLDWTQGKAWCLCSSLVSLIPTSTNPLLYEEDPDIYRLLN